MGRPSLSPGEIGQPWIVGAKTSKPSAAATGASPTRPTKQSVVLAKVRYCDHQGKVRYAEARADTEGKAKRRVLRRAEERLEHKAGELLTSESTLADLAAAWWAERARDAEKG